MKSSRRKQSFRAIYTSITQQSRVSCKKINRIKNEYDCTRISSSSYPNVDLIVLNRHLSSPQSLCCLICHHECLLAIDSGDVFCKMEIVLSSHCAGIYSATSNNEGICIMPFIFSAKTLMKKNQYSYSDKCTHITHSKEI